MLLLAATATAIPPRADAQDDLQFQQRRDRAKAALQQRMQARFSAGWMPKSHDEQIVTRLERLEDSRVRKQELANTRAQFEAARAEVYMQLVRHYTRIGHYRRAYTYTYAQDRVTGIVRPIRTAHDYWVLDPWAARLSAHFGSKAARSKGIAAAQEYHANTYYERLIRNTNTRISALKQKIAFEKQLAGQMP